MQRMDLVRFLAESAAELLDDRSTEGTQQQRLDEAAELLNLGSRILSRESLLTVETMQEAA